MQRSEAGLIESGVFRLRSRIMILVVVRLLSRGVMVSQTWYLQRHDKGSGLLACLMDVSPVFFGWLFRKDKADCMIFDR